MGIANLLAVGACFGERRQDKVGFNGDLFHFSLPSFIADGANQRATT